MSWAKYAKESLAAGERCQVKPRGNSMQPKVVSGATVTLAPVADPDQLKAGDIVLVTVRGRDYLHLIKAVRQEGDKFRFLIGNNRGGTNGWVGGNAVHGLAVEIDNG